jgi:hypothetical protein
LRKLLFLQKPAVPEALSPTAIVALLVTVSLVVGLAASLARRAHVPEPVFPAVYLSATFAYFLITRRAGRKAVRADPPRVLAEPAPLRATVGEPLEP